MLRVGYMHLKKFFFKKFTCQLTPTPNLASFSHFSSKRGPKKWPKLVVFLDFLVIYGVFAKY